MLAYQDLLNISPYDELFNDQQTKDKPADFGMLGISAGGSDQNESQIVLLLKALSRLSGMFGGGQNNSSDSYGGSESNGWTDVPRKAW